MIVDFAPTGLPLLFFTYDLEEYADDDPRLLRRLRGDGARRRCCATEDELAEALADPEAACAPFAGRREAFVAAFCPLDDGGAAARVADRVFS